MFDWQEVNILHNNSSATNDQMNSLLEDHYWLLCASAMPTLTGRPLGPGVPGRPGSPSSPRTPIGPAKPSWPVWPGLPSSPVAPLWPFTPALRWKDQSLTDYYVNVCRCISSTVGCVYCISILQSYFPQCFFCKHWYIQIHCSVGAFLL